MLVEFETQLCGSRRWEIEGNMWEDMDQSHCWSMLQEWVGMLWYVA